MNKQVLILYTELAGYTIACLNELSAGNVDVHVVCYPINTEAPFKFDFDDKIRVYERSSFHDSNSIVRFAKQLNPAVVVCCGWIDNSYLAVCRELHKSAITILTLDNVWSGTVKQRLGRLYFKLLVKKYFDYTWIPGNTQELFARKLGFHSDMIRKGFYAADVTKFTNVYYRSIESKSDKLPHVFIYTGRYVEVKGVEDLWEAFVRYKATSKCDWELWCLGTGGIEGKQHAAIKHFGFVQPEELPNYMLNSSVYVMPSRKEPWGVALQEFAVAGFPVIVSDSVTSAEVFVDKNNSGFVFESGNVASLVQAFHEITSLSDEKLLSMGRISHDKGMQITPRTWADTILKLIP